MNSLVGQTRTRFCARHALITTDGHVASSMPGLDHVRFVAHITPVIGARFAQSTLFFEATAHVVLTPGDDQYVFFLSAGEAEILAEGKTYQLQTGSYVYLPPLMPAEIRTTGTAATVVMFQKKYVPLLDSTPPSLLVGHESKIQGLPFLGNPRALLQVLLPDRLAFDLAVNIFTYEPGATLPFVETHVMEHGLLMLSGQGIYRLEDSWYPVMAGDVIWMASFCPQWFVAVGDVPASYLYYKDVNRPLLAP
jgi:(S)-ureidoglycine aminohydrolase